MPLSQAITKVAKKAPVYLRDPTKYKILDPTTVKYVPRDAFITGLLGPLQAQDVDLALALIGRRVNAGSTFQQEFVQLANTYDQLRRSEARLPKFSKWVTSLYPKRADLVTEFARLGQKVTTDVFEISGDLIDILRCADTTHFASCFKCDSSNPQIPKRIAEEAPGMCIIFSDDDKGKMKARTWGVHVKDPKGKDALMLGAARYGVFDLERMGNQISEKFGIDVYKSGGYDYYSYGSPPVKPVTTALETVNCFKERIYFDFQIWGTVNGTKINK